MHQQGTLHDIVGKCVPCRTVTQLTGHSSSPTDLPIVPVTQPETHSIPSHNHVRSFDLQPSPQEKDTISLTTKQILEKRIT
ncbi:hypothetical protein E2C01_003645 [Portunus trituberculatus]|uniref:Uncharacterized protein n=1 Tax=Portunus trituberculatus TaxID=210409 RepID=A0A5B7CP72_PORTR|nr:hypothetical protein [Portunus trituberculatus]